MAISATLLDSTKLQQNNIPISQLLNECSESIPDSTELEQSNLTVSQFLNPYSASLPKSTELHKMNPTVSQLLYICINQLQDPEYFLTTYYGELNPIWEFRGQRLKDWLIHFQRLDKQSLDDCMTDSRIKEEIVDLLYRIWNLIVDLDGYIKESNDKGICLVCRVMNVRISMLEALGFELRELLKPAPLRNQVE